MIDESEFEARRRQSLIIAERRRFAWIAAPPDLIDHPDLVLAFIADVRERLHPIVFDDLWGNVRKFRWTEAGRRRLHTSLASGQIDSVSFDGGVASPESPGASIR